MFSMLTAFNADQVLGVQQRIYMMAYNGWYS